MAHLLPASLVMKQWNSTPQTIHPVQFAERSGDFWDMDETHPRNTVFKPMALRHVLDQKHRQIATSGAAKDTEL